MKLIDKKGKVFGLINIIDLAVILIVALLVVGGASRMKSKPIMLNETKKALITYEIQDIRMPTVNNVVVGDFMQHYDRGGRIGEIVEVRHEPYKKALEGEKEWINAEVPGKYTLYITVESDVTDSNEFIVAGGEQTRIGGEYRLKNKKVAFFGVVVDVELLD